MVKAQNVEKNNVYFTPAGYGYEHRYLKNMSMSFKYFNFRENTDIFHTDKPNNLEG